MTILHGIAAILWPCVFAYAVWKIAPVITRFAPQGNGIRPDDVAIPDDLIGYASEYTESWAQDDTLRAIRERYSEYKDWDKVRRAFGLAPVK